jgi:hypothetical protein
VWVDWVVYTNMIKIVDRKRHSLCHVKQWYYTRPTKGNTNIISAFLPKYFHNKYNVILKWNKIYTSSNTTILCFIVLFDEVYILFHFNIILKHNGMSSTNTMSLSCKSVTYSYQNNTLSTISYYFSHNLAIQETHKSAFAFVGVSAQAKTRVFWTFKIYNLSYYYIKLCINDVKTASLQTGTSKLLNTWN